MEFSGTKEEMLDKAVDLLESSINRLLGEQEVVVLGVPGGRSVEAIYDRLKLRNIDWSRVHIFMLDERKVPSDDIDSNFMKLKKHLIDFIDIPPENVHPYNMEEGVLKYETELRQFGRYDVLLLSSGEDGHVASLFPRHHSIESEADYFVEMKDCPRPPPYRMSATKKILLRAQVAVLLFLGEEKRQVYAMFNDRNVDEFFQLPSVLVKKIPEYYVLHDL